MVLGNRAKWEIYNDFLDAVTKSDKLTDIISYANLSFSQLKRYSSEMKHSGLLRITRKDDRNKIYQATEKGKEFQKKFKCLISLIR